MPPASKAFLRQRSFRPQTANWCTRLDSTSEDSTMTVTDLATNVAGVGWMDQGTGAKYPAAADIARFAYHLYEMGGRQDGHDVEDWLLAEQELTQHYWLVADHT